MDSTTVDLKPRSLSEEQMSNIFPLVYAELQEEHQQIIDDASGDGRYKACPPVPDAAESFVDLAKERINRQREDFGGTPENRPEYLQRAYLKRDTEFSELQIAVEDMTIS